MVNADKHRHGRHLCGALLAWRGAGLIIKYQFYLITCPSNTPDQRKIAPAGPVACRDMVRYGMLKQGGVGYVMPYGMVW